MKGERYYVYRHVRPDTNEVFYIGKSSKTIYKDSEYYKRAYSKKGRSQDWLDIVHKNPNYIIQIIYESDDYNIISDKEIEFIKLYGRMDNGSGTLCNLTSGGDGQLERIVSLNTRNKISNYHTGKKETEQTRRNMSFSKIGYKNHRAKKVIDTETGKKFDTVKEAAMYFGVNYTTLVGYLSGFRRNKTSLKYLQ